MKRELKRRMQETKYKIPASQDGKKRLARLCEVDDGEQRVVVSFRSDWSRSPKPDAWGAAPLSLWSLVVGGPMRGRSRRACVACGAATVCVRAGGCTRIAWWRRWVWMEWM